MPKPAIVTEKPKLSREERITRELAKLESDLANGNFRTLRTRVALILSRYEETRNSDTELQLRYWSTFNPDQYRYENTLTPELFRDLEKLTNLARARAKIQNEYLLYLADPAVKTERTDRSKRYSEDLILDKPLGTPTTVVYCDETGKASKYLCVGGLWLTSGYDSWRLHRHLASWKDINGVKAKEFHFAKLSKLLLPYAKLFFKEALHFAGGFGFKAVLVQNDGLKHTPDDALRELHYQLIRKGISHDQEHGRTSLPRQVIVYKDEDAGYDRLHLERLREDLISSFSKSFGDNLQLDELSSMSSQESYMIQLADIFVASLNRILERKSDDPLSHKDEMADFVLDLLGIMDDGEKLVSKRDFVLIDYIELKPRL